MRFVVFNGPPGCGKTTAAQMLLTLLRNKGLHVNSDSFAAPMKHFAATLFADQYYKMKKDEPMAELRGQTVRQLLIDLSEDFLKPKYGEDVLGRMLYYRSLRAVPPPDFVIVDDSGFDEEFHALGEIEHRYLVRIKRPGTNYLKDSRHYLDHPYWVLVNDGSLDIYRSHVYALSTTLVMIHRGEIDEPPKQG